MSEHPDVAELLDRWEDIALDQSTWAALARILTATRVTQPNVHAELSTEELTEMVRAGVCFISQSLPDLAFNHDAALVAVTAVANALHFVTAIGAHYSIADALAVASREAYGL